MIQSYTSTKRKRTTISKHKKICPRLTERKADLQKTNNRTTGNRGTAGGDIVVFDSNTRRSDEA